jgi:peptidyl-prolyl cis-trans isomerase B (cyclophilin B)
VASSKRERELARRRLERQAARRAEAEARRRRRRRNAIASLAGLVAIGLIATLVVPKLTDDDKTQTAAGECTYKPEGPKSKEISGLPPTTPTTKTGTLTAALETNRGQVELSLLPEKAPCTVNSFAFLAAQKYFDSTPCHRLTTTPGLRVLQCGSPDGSGNGGPGYEFADENLGGATYKKGTVAMANGGPGTNGSQFFLVYADSQLPPNYTPFGTITKGLDVLEAVAKGGADAPTGDGKPKLPVTLTKVTVA